MTKFPLSFEQAKQLCLEYKYLVGRDLTGEFPLPIKIDSVVISPYDEINKHTFLLEYRTCRNAGKALGFYTGDQYQVLLLGKIISDKVEIVCENLFSYLSQHNLPFIGSVAAEDDIGASAHQEFLRRKIADNEHNLQTLINNTKDLIWSVDLNANIILANKAFTKWTTSFLGQGLQAGDYLFHHSFGKDLIKRWQGLCKRAFKGKSSTVVEAFIRGGRIEHAEARISPIYDAEHSIIGASCTSRDITEQKNAYLIIEEQNQKLKEIAWLQSHEARAPVARILGLKQLFNKDNPSDPINKEVLDSIEEEVLQLDRIIRRIDNRTSITNNS